MSDLISRQAAIDIVVFECGKWTGLAKEICKQIKQLPSAQPEQDREFIKLTVRNSNGKPYYSIIYLEVDDNGVGHDFEGYSSYSLDVISDYLKMYFMPSVQPDPCVDTIDMLDESIKHFDDMAEECRRNANIERNNYMDMKDDAAEYRQLSDWLNELKWLRERLQSHPQPEEFEWCHDCKEYDQDKHYCPRWTKVIRRTVEELKAQPKTGKWIDVPHTFFTKCSACEWLNDIHDFDYCPNCGAMMKEGD